MWVVHAAARATRRSTFWGLTHTIFNWCTVIVLFLTSQLNPHRSPYCTESTQDPKDLKICAASEYDQCQKYGDETELKHTW